jgi:DNA adenine methylase
VKPFLKWAGGKRQIMEHIKKYVDNHYLPNATYYEPFVGGGSVFITLEISNSVINDLNPELMNCYRVIKESPNELIEMLKKHAVKHNEDENYFYKVRVLDRNIDQYNKISAIEKAARTIYLNKTCYNGLYRVNSKGFFNTPKGRYKNPNIVDEQNIHELSDFFNKSNVVIKNMGFSEAVKAASSGDFLYFDPPYDYEVEGFTKYVKEGFSFENLKDLKNICDELIDKGCKVLISNNATERVINLFKSDNYEIEVISRYKINELDVRRYISGKAKGRKLVKEVLIFGHK